MYNFELVNCDTDSIMVCKSDKSIYTEEEQKKLLKELNSLFLKNIKWEPDGTFKKVIILKAKNYILQDFDNKITYKGSALKSSKTEIALKEFLHAIIAEILNETYNYKEVYNKYVVEILNVKDINRWTSKKSLTSTTYSSLRANETKIIDAIQGTEYKEGDRVFLYFRNDGTLKLAEKFENDHDIGKLLKKLYTTAQIFANIIPKETFINFSLKKNQELLNEFR